MVQLIDESFNPNDFVEQEEDVKDTFIEWELAHHFEQWEKIALDDLVKDPILKKQVLRYTPKNRSLTERFRHIKEELRHYNLMGK
jgi:hypothetical protein